ncbi:AAA family ATPase, partial [bacterium]|nr:AAA family ATPase [bacterium]
MTGLDGFPDAALLTLDDFRSADAPMVRCLEIARAACRTEIPILVLGESGTGKTLLARAIHNSSRRAAGPFVSFNAAALSDTLLDSQLFG